MQRPTELPLATFAVARVGEVQRVRVHLDHAVEGRATAVDRRDARQVALGHRASRQVASGHPALQVVDRRFVQIDGRDERRGLRGRLGGQGPDGCGRTHECPGSEKASAIHPALRVT